MARTILMTGSKGFVGGYLRAALAKRYPDTIVIPLTTTDEVDPGFVAADLLDAAAIETAMARAQPDVVVHLAAQASVARTVQNSSATFAINLGGSLNLALAIARQAPRATLLFASSSEVYGRSFLAGPVTEASPTLPMNDYARSKRLAEDMFAAVLPTSTKLFVARPFNHAGAGQREDFVLASFAGQIARIEAGLQPPQMMIGNVDVRRDFLDVRDVVDAYLALLDAAPDLSSRFTCNIATGTTRPLRDYVRIFRTLARVPFEIVVDPGRLRPIELPVAEGDATLLRRMTGWAPKVGITEMLRDLLEATRRTLADRAR